MSQTKAQLLFDLSMQIEACSRCPYGGVRQQPLLGTGEHRSPILIIGDMARPRDDQENTIFSGRAGRKLDTMLAGAELDPTKVYKTLLVRCNGGREPQFGDYAAFKRCQRHSLTMLKILKPRAVVVCGLNVFKWLIVKWTGELVDDKTFFRWIGRAIRLKEIWGEIKFFIIQSPAQLARIRSVDEEAKSIEALGLLKHYVTSQQKSGTFALDMTDLKRKRHIKTEQQKFDWS